LASQDANSKGTSLAASESKDSCAVYIELWKISLRGWSQWMTYQGPEDQSAPLHTYPQALPVLCGQQEKTKDGANRYLRGLRQGQAQGGGH
jgi:hypothetical protein